MFMVFMGAAPPMTLARPACCSTAVACGVRSGVGFNGKCVQTMMLRRMMGIRRIKTIMAEEQEHVVKVSENIREARLNLKCLGLRTCGVRERDETNRGRCGNIDM